MKTLFNIITLFISSLTITLFIGCEEKDRNLNINPNIGSFEDFITIKNDRFYNGDTTLFPIMMNYMIQLRLIDNELVVSPTIEYDSLNKVEGNSKEDIHQRLKAHFQLINEMGFNTLRLVGLNLVDYTTYYPEMSLSRYDSIDGKKAVKISPKHLSQILNSTQEVINLAKQCGLRTMILLPKPRKQNLYDIERLKFIKAILDFFSKEKAVFAYDFFNEPLYFDNSEFKEFYNFQRTKEEAYRIVNSWKNLMGKYAPNQLFTIGFAEPIEVFEWDPSILPVDFVTFHTYGPLRVPNEIYWYANYTKKPWMLGETSLPADNDSISYKEQAVFMNDVLQRVINCGGQGLGWWQFQDVLWGPFEHNYTALVNHKDSTKTKGGLTVYGTVKDAGKVIPNFNFEKTGECVCNSNYYNILGYKNYKLSGKIISKETGKSVEGAVIRGWNEWWSIGANTFTNKNGEFNLYSNTPFHHFEISAPGLTTYKLSKKINYEKVSSEPINNTELEYHNIHYQNFIKKNQKVYSTFNFEETLFNKFSYNFNIGVIELKPIQLELLGFEEELD